MAISDVEFKKEVKILDKVNKLFDETYNNLASDVKVGEEDLIEFNHKPQNDGEVVEVTVV